jgi:hypothetical protein
MIYFCHIILKCFSMLCSFFTFLVISSCRVATSFYHIYVYDATVRYLSVPQPSKFETRILNQSLRLK